MHNRDANSRNSRLTSCVVQGLKDDVRENLAVQDVVKPSLARENVVCLTCLNRSIKTIARVSGKRGPNAGEDEQGGSSSRPRTSTSPEKRKKKKAVEAQGSDSGGSGVFVSTVIRVQ